MTSNDDPRVHNRQGMEALGAGRFAEAVTAFTRATELDPGEPVLRINLAAAHRQAGDETGEQAALEAAIGLDARHFLANLRLAELFERQGLLSKAAPHWSAVVQLVPGMPAPPASALDAARVASDIVLLGQDMAAIGDALRISRQARRRIVENFGISAFYNVVAVPLALAGFATPLAAALAMSLSSVTVSLNALRLR